MARPRPFQGGTAGPEDGNEEAGRRDIQSRNNFLKLKVRLVYYATQGWNFHQQKMKGRKMAVSEQKVNIYPLSKV